MLYYILRPLARFALKIFFRKIYIDGEKLLPGKDTAMIFACNHPNGFLEPIILACVLNIPMHFLVRGDLFNNKWLKPLLIGTHQIPIYRFRDGFSALKSNLGTMQESLKIIGEKKALLIYPEGTTIQTIYLRPLKKGAARLAIQSKLLNPDLPINLIPVGVNYTDPNAFRSDVMIKIGTPIDIQVQSPDVVAENKQIMSLTNTLEQGMQKMVKQIKDPKDEAFVKDILKIKSTFEPHKVLPIVERNGAHLDSDQHLVQQFNAFPDKDLLRKELTSIKEQMKVLHMHEPFKKDHVLIYIFKGIFLILLAPIFLLSFIAHFVPVGIAVYITKRFVKEREFTTSVLTVSGAALVSLHYLILFFIFLFIQMAFLWLIPLLFASLFFSINYIDVYNSFSDQFRGRLKPLRQWKIMYKSCKVFLARLDINI